MALPTTTLGQTGQTVTKPWVWGHGTAVAGPARPAQVEPVLEWRCFDAGINVIDTAPDYGCRRSTSGGRSPPAEPSISWPVSAAARSARLSARP